VQVNPQTDSAGAAAGSFDAPKSGIGEDAGRRLFALTSLIEQIDVPETKSAEAPKEHTWDYGRENQLAVSKLGVASSLFLALRAKHPATASHSLRVAVALSAWSLERNLTDDQRDKLEVAALLHDIGKIGVPDSVLLKPGRLSPEEIPLISAHTRLAREILQGCLLSHDVIEIIQFAPLWYNRDGKLAESHAEQRIPLGARMLQIVDAFDSMTTDQIYRRAMSKERAIAELHSFAGRQFDPELVVDFANLVESNRLCIRDAIDKRWLSRLSDTAKVFQAKPAPDAEAPAVRSLFTYQIFETMPDGVLFVDGNRRIEFWNQAMERLTKMSWVAVAGEIWRPELVDLRDERGRRIPTAQCPVQQAIVTKSPIVRRVDLRPTEGSPRIVDLHASPVMTRDGKVFGATVLFRDASPQVDLEENLKALRRKSSLDGLTQVANRAEFDRVHGMFVQAHLSTHLPCSLIICDIDFFKRINDRFGHPAGDEALVAFAALLKRHVRNGDLVARYGGEEFVILCAECNNATATERAELIRAELEAMTHPFLNGGRMTSSFGVTELQEGDTSEAMLRRADRAMILAKEGGRNRVVQLGAGGAQSQVKESFWKRWFGHSNCAIEKKLMTPVPLAVTVEKLRGFVADHDAQVIFANSEHVVLKLQQKSDRTGRRGADGEVTFQIELSFAETQVQSTTRKGDSSLRTVFYAVVRPLYVFDRRSRRLQKRGDQMLHSIKSYLIAQDFSGVVPVERYADVGTSLHGFGLSRFFKTFKRRTNADRERYGDNG
jgi:diguanylate cyclase (GGDEF)-like protein/PAS domain S-box-containing protein